MKVIPIVTEDIVTGTSVMHDRHGRLDLMGQILFTGFGIRVRQFAETPANMECCVHPFSTMVRERVHNTELTLTILRNAKTLSPSKQLDVANKLLDPFNIRLERIEY